MQAMTMYRASEKYRTLARVGATLPAALGVLLSAISAMAAAPINRIEDVRVTGSGDNRTVRITTASQPTFTVFRLNDPMRVVIDVSGGELGAMHGPLVFEDGVIGQVALRQFNSDGFLIGRVIIGFEHDYNYDVKTDGNAVVLRSTGVVDAPLTHAAPPAVGPADRAAAERFESARVAAQEAATEAKQQREQAKKAVAEAKTKKEEADRVAKEAVALAQQAQQAREDAMALRHDVDQGAAANRSRAEALAQEAEARQHKLAVAAREVADARAESARVAKDAEDARRGAENRANLAESEHKQRETALQAQLQEAQTEVKTAKAEAVAARAVQVTAAPAEMGAVGPVPEPTLSPAPVTPPALALRDVAPVVPESDDPTEAPLRKSRGNAELTSIKPYGGKNAVLLRFNGTPSFVVDRLTDPPRLVIDIKDARRKLKGYVVNLSTPWATRVRLGEPEQGVVRAVFDMNEGFGEPEVQSVTKGLLVQVKQAQAVGELLDVRVHRGSGRSASVDLKVHGSVRATVDHSSNAWVLQLDNTTVSTALERSFDTTAFNGVLHQVSTYQASRTPPVVHIVATLDGTAKSRVRRNGDTITWEMLAPADENSPVASAAAPATAGFAAVAETFARSTPTQAVASNKRHISLDVKDADIVNVLRLISEETGENIIASDDVKGKVTLKLRNVPADLALDTMLRTKGFDKVRQNNILRIAPADVIQKERDNELLKHRAQAEVEETLIKMITVNYATASEIVDQVKPMLTGRGSVQVDSRTNTLIVNDIASNVDRLVELARRLDKQTPMVMIQARIVEATTSYLRDLGVQWGGMSQYTSMTGNRTGLYFPGDVRTSGAADDPRLNQTAGLSTPTNYAVNLPASLAGAGGGLGFILGSADGAQILNLRLTAMEQSGNGKIISSPEVATLDNKTATVSQGIDIPISTVSAAGTNTRFISAALELQVTPHVTNDGTVLMKIKTTKSQPDFTQKGAAGDPTISRKFAETEVLVRDGDTSVIGGIYQRTTSENFSEVPFLARIPLLGNLFREHRSEDDRAELLVFITPRIVNREESQVPGSTLMDTSAAAAGAAAATPGAATPGAARTP